ncbi:MAG: HDOD domain-containing protein [Rubrivivax sp.]
MDPQPTPPLLTRAERDVETWARRFDPQSLPVLAETAAALELWRLDEDAVDAHGVSDTLSQDPLMMLKLFSLVASITRRRGSEDARSDPETVTAAMVMLGIGPFFRAFGPQPLVGDTLQATLGALDGFRAVLRRSTRAAAFAIGFAAHRMDPDAAVLHEAALLHDFAELLLWLRAPTLALTITHRQRADPALRTAQAQRDVLNIELPDLQQRLMRHWHLPALLARSTDHRHADDPQVRNVLLAIRVARHSADGWDNPALPDDVTDIAALLQLSPASTLRLLRDIDAADPSA